MKMILTALLALGLMGSAHATVEKMPVVAPGGFSNLSGGSQFVLAAVVTTVAIAAYNNRNWHCTESAPFVAPGTNWTQTKFENCVEK